MVAGWVVGGGGNDAGFLGVDFLAQFGRDEDVVETGVDVLVCPMMGPL